VVLYPILIKLIYSEFMLGARHKKRNSFRAYLQLRVSLFISIGVSVDVNGETCCDSVWCVTFVKTVTS